MKMAKVLSAIGFLVMLYMILRAIFVGDFNGEGADLIRGPWGQLSLVDVYIGFFLFAGWIIYREKSFVRSTMWIVLLMVLGNLTACLYVLIALQTSKNDWRKFWLGHRFVIHQ
ncbi:MAG: DUF1475 family protein [Anaerolineae bacterium]|nr:DUF1475 family protein [Anaerolineae bacterium]